MFIEKYLLKQRYHVFNERFRQLHVVALLTEGDVGEALSLLKAIHSEIMEKRYVMAY